MKALTAVRRLGVPAAALPLLALRLLAGGAPQAGAQERPAETGRLRQAPLIVNGPVSEDGKDSDAACPAGTKVIGGGHVSRTFWRANGGTMYDAVTASAPVSQGQGWFARQMKDKTRARVQCIPG
ncbi:hypothetical protein [Streptomyces noursei]|uniref:hypothetical protein n=1 Tax=Streptomyces noursei TaxID=1971 RepID=UPI00167AAAF7|nr:hypothetical protein [Streptomyces noursei]MCZ1019087.1 hypothetical protein [Streptomyces noursei]GGX31492.1 hypothetical protein GCM10010341_61190 [Streptomyces noursei]